MHLTGENPLANAFVDLNMNLTTILPKLSGCLLRVYTDIIITRNGSFKYHYNAHT